MARIIVLVKDLPDNKELKINPMTKRLVTNAPKRKLNDLDKRALEAALRLKEKNGGEVFTLSIGDEATKTSILEALAMGADAAFIVSYPLFRDLDSRAVSLILATALRKIGDYNLILAGELSLDDMSGQVGPRVAVQLDVSLVSYAKELLLSDGILRATRNLEDCDEIIEADLPALATTVREIADPRIPSLMNILKAKKKPINMLDVGALGVAADALIHGQVDTLEEKLPDVNRKKIIIRGESLNEVVEKLVTALINDEVVGA